MNVLADIRYQYGEFATIGHIRASSIWRSLRITRQATTTPLDELPTATAEKKVSPPRIFGITQFAVITFVFADSS
jgi:hypothetical protein